MRKMTIKEYIIDYAKDRYYFHINDLREYFAEKGTEFKKDSLKKCLYLLKKKWTYLWSRERMVFHYKRGI